jgi:seryl-tRNA synthetase
MGKAVAIIKEEPVLMQDNAKEDANLVLQKLSIEEANLIEEKQNLASLKEKLQMKILEKIEGKKNNIQKLRDEIKELKFSCEELTQTLKAGT